MGQKNVKERNSKGKESESSFSMGHTGSENIEGESVSPYWAHVS